MNRTDAAKILNVDPSASPEEARRAYQELFTEHQVRLTNAPTPALRSLYQSRLLELDEAKDALLATDAGDETSDLPTDQPSIPSSQRSVEPPQRTPPPPPPPLRKSGIGTPPPPPPVRKQPESAVGAPGPAASQKPSPGRTKGPLALIGGAVAVALVLLLIGNVISHNRTSDGTSSDTASSAPPTPSLKDSLPKLRESITVARVEFGRGDYDAANRALADADSFYTRVSPADAASDTAVAGLKTQLEQLHSKVNRACEALKKVAARHPGEPTCKTL
jgi:hypothetical protein